MNTRATPVTSAEIERLLWHMPTVATRASNAWARDFALSIKRQANRKGWKPSPKQLAMMRSMVSELFTHEQEESELQLIES